MPTKTVLSTGRIDPDNIAHRVADALANAASIVVEHSTHVRRGFAGAGPRTRVTLDVSADDAAILLAHILDSAHNIKCLEEEVELLKRRIAAPETDRIGELG